MNDDHHPLSDRLAALAARVEVEARDVGRQATYDVTARNRTALRVGLASVVLAGAVGVGLIIRQRGGEQQAAAPSISSDGGVTDAASAGDRVWPLVDFADGPIEIGDRRLSELAASLGEGGIATSSTRVFMAGDAERIVTLTTFETDVPDFEGTERVERDGFTEIRWPDSTTPTLTFEADGLIRTVVGADAVLNEQFVRHALDVGVGSLSTDMPGGLIEVAQPSVLPPRSEVPMLVGGGDVTAVTIESLSGSVYGYLAEYPERRRLDVVGRLDAWIASDPGRERAPTGLLGLPDGNTFGVFGQTASEDQLVALIRRLKFVREDAWRAYYGLPATSDGGGATTGTDALVPPAPPTTPIQPTVTGPESPDSTVFRTIPLPAGAPEATPDSVVEGPIEVVYLAGDSDAANLLTGLQPLIADPAPTARLETFYKVSSGLSRPDFFDWPAQLERDLAEFDPPVVVFVVGSNDAQDLLIDGTYYAVGSPEWEQEYARRVGVAMDLLTSGGRKVIWVGVPNAVDPSFDERLAVLRRVTIAQAENRPSLRYIDTAALFVGFDGRVSERQIDPRDGVVKPVRADDGYHLNPVGVEILARSVYAAIAEELMQLKIDAILEQQKGG